MNFSTPDMQSFWDISAQQPDTFSALPDDDFLAFLQKQFPGAVGPLTFHNPDGVDPQSIGGFPPPNLSPPSSDSSPSPPSTHNDSSLSRRQSGVFNDTSPSAGPDPLDDASLKRKASDDNDDDDEPQSKSQHTSPANAKKNNNAALARRKPGAPQDESRLLKRKEQNRAAQRAFRERKEKHVKDLEEKVAALEAKNQLTEQENENLRDLLQRLQNENMMLKQAAFTFSAPRSTLGNGTNSSQPSFGNHSMQFNFSSPGAGPSKDSHSPPPSSSFDINYSSLIAFDPNMFNPSDDSQDSTMDGTFSNNASQYKTIASNPMFTSFAEPSPSDIPPYMNGQQYTPSGVMESFTDHWTTSEPGGQDIDQLFGSNFLSSTSGTSGVDFQALLASPPSSLSPVSHASMRTPSLSSSSSSPSGGANPASPPASNGTHGTEECPKTKEQLSKLVAQSGQSSFVHNPAAAFIASPSSSPSLAPSPGENTSESAASCELPFAPFLKKTTAEEGGPPFVMCRGSSFPRTQKSDKNVEVLTAWRTITSNPQFKDVDINELCTEFTNKARCDGTKVVLEPEGVHHIIETLAARQAQKPLKQ